MENNYELAYEQIINRLREKNSINIDNVIKAYELALALHEGQARITGEPYINHPLQVALILEKLNFDTDVICSAILHDVIEDCNYSVKLLKTEFNANVANIVDAVTAIDKDKYQINDENIFEDQEFLKFSQDEQSFTKLLSMGKRNKLAFFIKFADRLHNLSTIESFSDYKQLEKVTETERWILPVAKILKSNYFYKAIKNECFKIRHRIDGQMLFSNHRTYHKLNIPYYQKLQLEIFNQMAKYLNKIKDKAELLNIKIEQNNEENEFECLKKIIKIKSCSEVKLSHLNKVPANNIYVIFKNNIALKQAFDYLFYCLNNELFSGIKLIGYECDEVFNIPYFVIEDNIRNKYRITALSFKEYCILQNGSVDGVDMETFDETSTGEIYSDFINIITRSGEVIKMPENCTVLDFAFKLHNELGFSCKYAIINNAPTKYPLYTKLNNGDKVILVTEVKEDTKEPVNIAKLRWLAYVKTENAQKALIKYFEKKIGN